MEAHLELWFYDNLEDNKELLAKGLSLEQAIASAKDELENCVEQDEIDEERFHIADDWDDDGKPITQVYYVVNMWTGIVSDFYAEIREES